MTERRKPEMQVRKGTDSVTIRVVNAGQAGRIFQFREGNFIRVVPYNEFVGVYSDVAIAKGPKECILKKTRGYIDNKVILPADDWEGVADEVKRNFPKIYILLTMGKLKRR